MKALQQKKIVSLILIVIVFSTIIYFEGDGFEVQRLIVGIIGVLEVVLVLIIQSWIDLLANEKKWKAAEKTARIIGVSIGLIFTTLAIDRMINYTLTSYNLDYAITWTVTFPIAVIIVYTFRAMDILSFINEQKKIHGK